MPLPVRVSLRGHNGRYLCTSHATVSAHAEVPCCCEEFLLQVGPIPLGESLDAEVGTLPRMWSLHFSKRSGLSPFSFYTDSTSAKLKNPERCFSIVEDAVSSTCLLVEETTMFE